jgi:hypothetical protein
MSGRGAGGLGDVAAASAATALAALAGGCATVLRLMLGGLGSLEGVVAL